MELQTLYDLLKMAEGSPAYRRYGYQWAVTAVSLLRLEIRRHETTRGAVSRLREGDQSCAVASRDWSQSTRKIAQ